MDTITLEGLEFFSYHGVYKEEQTIGNRYIVDVSVQTDLSEVAKNDSIADTINYEVVYKAVKDQMMIKCKLLETIGQRIIDKIYEAYPMAKGVEVRISKMNPPIGGVCKRAQVVLRR